MSALRRVAAAALLLVGCGKVVTGAEPPDGGGPTGGRPPTSEGGVAIGGGGSTGGGSTGGSGFGGSAGDGRAGSGGAAGVVVLPDPDGDGGEPARIGLPPRPMQWDPGFPLGSPGWRGSTVPFCSEDVGELEPRVWSTPGAVYALIGTSCNELADDVCNTVSTSYSAQVLYRNDGAAWKEIFRQPDRRGDSAQLTGFADGSVVIASDSACSVEQVSPTGNAACLSAGLPPLFISAARATGQTLYILASPQDDSTTEQIWSYGESTWKKLWSGPSDVRSIAAGGGIAVGSGENQAWTLGPDGTRAALPGTPAASYGSAWTYGANDLYLGNVVGGVAHYDGTLWNTTNTPFVAGGVGEMWGAPDGTVFLISNSSLGRLAGGAFQTLAEPSGNAAADYFYFGEVWGNSANEVFLTVNDMAFRKYTCGTTFLVWFDGKAFHQF